MEEPEVDRDLDRDRDIDLFRIDLAEIVDRYIGETERQLDAVLDGAESRGSVSLPDEADDLFGSGAGFTDHD